MLRIHQKHYLRGYSPNYFAMMKTKICLYFYKSKILLTRFFANMFNLNEVNHASQNIEPNDPRNNISNYQYTTSVIILG